MEYDQPEKRRSQFLDDQDTDAGKNDWDNPFSSPHSLKEPFQVAHFSNDTRTPRGSSVPSKVIGGLFSLNSKSSSSQCVGDKSNGKNRSKSVTNTTNIPKKEINMNNLLDFMIKLTPCNRPNFEIKLTLCNQPNFEIKLTPCPSSSTSSWEHHVNSQSEINVFWQWSYKYMA